MSNNEVIPLIRIAKCQMDVLTSKISEFAGTPISEETFSSRCCVRALDELSTLFEGCTATTLENLLSKTGLGLLVNKIRTQRTLPRSLRNKAKLLRRKWKTAVMTPPSVTPSQRPRRIRKISARGREAAASDARFEQAVKNNRCFDPDVLMPYSWKRSHEQENDPEDGDSWNGSCATDERP